MRPLLTWRKRPQVDALVAAGGGNMSPELIQALVEVSSTNTDEAFGLLSAAYVTPAPSSCAAVQSIPTLTTHNVM